MAKNPTSGSIEITQEAESLFGDVFEPLRVIFDDFGKISNLLGGALGG